MTPCNYIVYPEVCDPSTFRRVPFGSRGTPVYTHLERTSQPMIRLVSGDLTVWENGPNPCGRTYPRLPLGIFGRIDDMFTIRGENVYPSEIRPGTVNLDLTHACPFRCRAGRATCGTRPSVPGLSMKQ